MIPLQTFGFDSSADVQVYVRRCLVLSGFWDSPGSGLGTVRVQVWGQSGFRFGDSPGSSFRDSPGSGLGTVRVQVWETVRVQVWGQSGSGFGFGDW